MGRLKPKTALFFCLFGLIWTVRPSFAQQHESNHQLESEVQPEDPARIEASSLPEEAAPAKAEEGAPEITPTTSSENAARAAFQEGDRLYYEGDYQGAVLKFEQAYAMSGRIEMLFNLANAHERLGNYTQASGALRGYIPHAPQNGRASLERRLARLEELAAEKRNVPLAPPPSIEAPSTPPVKMIPFNRAIGIGLVTLGGVSLALGTGFAISAGKARNELSEQCVEGATGQLCPQDAEPYVKKDKSHSIAADISFITGAALSITGVYFVLKKTDEGQITAKVGPGSLRLEGSF